MKKLIVKYSIEFLVIFFGITISFTLQEYSKQNASLKKQQDGLKRVLKDLKLDEFIFEAYDPKVFSGKKSVELTLLKDHANTATIIQESLNANPKEMTTFEYYQKLSYLQDKAKQQKKNAKKTK